MGLLDNLFATPESQAQFALSTGLFGVRRGNEGAALQNAMGVYNQAQEAQRRQQFQDLQRQVMEGQMRERDAKARAEAEAARLKQRGFDYLSSGGARPVGSTVMRPETMAQPPQLDPLKLIQFFGPEAAQKIMESRNWGRDEVARTIEEEGPNGEKMVRRETRFGDQVGAPVRGYIPPQLVNQGDRQSFVKPLAGVSLPMGMSPSERDASARGWANIGLERERMTQQTAADRRAQEKAIADEEKARARQSAAVGQATRVIDAVDKALPKVGVTTTGPMGAAMLRWPGSEAVNLRSLVKEIRANIGFRELQAMREASPTGGALGQVAVMELDMLQSTLGNLDQEQSPGQLREQLNKVRTHFANWKAAVEQAQSPQGGGGGSWAPAPGTVEDGYVFKGGDPADSKNWVKQ